MIENEEIVGTVVPKNRIEAVMSDAPIAVQWFEIVKVTCTPEEGDEESSPRTFYRYNAVGVYPMGKKLSKLNQEEGYYSLKEKL